MVKGEAVRTKWKNLRDGYVKYIRNGSSSMKKIWRWASQLNFLQNTIALQKGEKRSSENEYDEISLENNAADATQTEPLPKKLKSDEVIEVIADLDTSLNCLEDKNNKYLDLTDYLFLNYADTFKKLTPRSQVLLKMELAQMFGQAECYDMSSGAATTSS